MVTLTDNSRYRATAMQSLRFVLVALLLVAGCKASPAPAVGREAPLPGQEGVVQFGAGMTRPSPLAEGEIVFTR